MPPNRSDRIQAHHRDIGYELSRHLKSALDNLEDIEMIVNRPIIPFYGVSGEIEHRSASYTTITITIKHND